MLKEKLNCSIKPIKVGGMMKVVPFKQYREGINDLIDLDTCPAHMQMDYRTRNKNVMDNHKLCKRCDGTGNELMSMFRRCIKCNGSGINTTEEPNQ